MRNVTFAATQFACSVGSRAPIWRRRKTWCARRGEGCERRARAGIVREPYFCQDQHAAISRSPRLSKAIR